MALVDPAAAAATAITDGRLRIVLENSRTIAFTLDLDYRVTWISEVVGMPVSAVVGRTMMELSGPGEAEPFLEVGRRLLETGGSLDFEGKLTWIGVTRIYAIRATLERDVAGTPVGFLVALTDISPLRSAEDEATIAAEELRRARAALELALSETRTIAFTLDRSARFEWMAGAIAPLSPEARTPEEVWPWLRSEQTSAAFARVLSGESVELEIDVPATDGPRSGATFRIVLAPRRDADGAITGVLGTASDVSRLREADAAIRRSKDELESLVAARNRELAESEARLRDIVEGVDAIVWEEDVTTGRLTVSGQSVDILGYPLEAWQAPDFWKDIVVPEDRDRVTRALDGDVDADIEYGAFHADGTLRRLRDRMTVVLDGEGRVLRRYGLTLDVTQVRELEARAFAAERLEALGRLAGQIAHDVDNILYGIGVFAEYATRAYERGEDPRPDLEQVVAALAHGSALTRNLLDFARSRPGRPVRLDVGRVVAEFRPMMERFLGPSTTIEIVGADREYPVMADRAALQQVLLNLTTNAAAAMPAGGRCTIALARVRRPRRLERELPAGPYVEIRVSDTGIGMTPDVAARVFEPFFTTKAEGTGLGLPSVYGIVRTFHGAIEVASEPGHGATFTILLPIERDAAPSTPATSAAEPART